MAWPQEDPLGGEGGRLLRGRLLEPGAQVPALSVLRQLLGARAFMAHGSLTRAGAGVRRGVVPDLAAACYQEIELLG